MFNLGSTVIVLIVKLKSQWCDNINVGQKILIRDDILKFTRFNPETYSFFQYHL